MEKQEMIKKFKESTNKLQCIDTLCAETGLTAVEVIKVLIEHKIDGRIFRQGRFAAEYREAKKMVIEESVKAAAAANASLKEIREENERLKSEADDKCGTCDYKNRVQFLEDENKRLNTAIEEIDKLKKDADKVIEVLQDKVDSNELADEINDLQADYAYDIIQMLEIIDGIKSDYDSASERASKLMDECDAESLRAENLAKELVDAREEIAIVSKENAKLESELRKLREFAYENDALNKRLSLAEKFILNKVVYHDL